MKRKIKKLNDETGVTLVELLAAIAILSVIVTAFLAFFIQAARTNQHTNSVNEATFLAQETMEEVIYLAANHSAEDVIDRIDSAEYLERKKQYTITSEITPFQIEDSEIEYVEKLKEANLYKVVILVTEGGKDRAKMENILSFREEQDEEGAAGR